MEQDGLYSEGSQSSFSESRVIQCPLINKLVPGSICGRETGGESLMALTAEPYASSFPSGEKATALPTSLSTSSVCSGAPEPASQSLTVLSAEADASSLPSGEKATA